MGLPVIIIAADGEDVAATVMADEIVCGCGCGGTVADVVIIGAAAVIVCGS